MLVCKYLFKSLPLVLLGLCPKEEWLDRVVIVCVIFGGLPYHIPQQLYQLYSQGFHFLLPLPTLVICRCFDNSHPNGCEVECHCGDTTVLCIEFGT